MIRQTVIEYLIEKGVIAMGYRTCPHCGANLDPEEKCDCLEEAEDQKEQKASPAPASIQG